MKKSPLLSALLVIISGLLCWPVAANTASPVQIAFLADIHLHDPYSAAQGLPANELPKDPITGAPLLLRSMNAQLHSTRLFNENYWVLRAALDDIASREIKLVALPGDFSDDGQPANIRALNTLLNDYAERYGMRFYAMNGNHDPTRPFSRAGGKHDFLAADGTELSVVSSTHPACINQQAWQCSDALQEWGYADITATLASHGFTPHQDDIFFETPFNTTPLTQRHWQWCDKRPANKDCLAMPDSSYLVEPVEGIWLLAIDANVYVPAGPLKERNFNGSGNAGYNALLTYKPELIRWIKNVASRARKAGKKLIAFSHFPMADFYDQQAPDMAALFGSNTMQLARLPSQTTTESLADTGLTLHFAGHMHLYDIARSEQGGLLNVQVPSLAAYQPGYSLLTINPDSAATIDTVIVKNVANFNRWFTLYTPEWQYRHQSATTNWDNTIVQADNYLAFTDAHLQQIIRQRYLPREWPAQQARLFREHTVGELLALTHCPSLTPHLTPEQSRALNAPGMQLIDDYYRARNAGAFARLDGRRDFYQQLADQLSPTQCHVTPDVKQDSHTQQLTRILSLIATSIGASASDQQRFDFTFD